MIADKSLVVDSSTASDMTTMDQLEQGLPWRTFEKWMGDLRNQPAWRALADKCADYYDGNQLTVDQLTEMESLGMQPITANIIRPTIDVVLGMEAKTRSDWRVRADSAEFQDVAEAQSFMLAQAEREAKADRACSDAYAGQIKAGLHWVEVSRSMNPYEYPYRARPVHRREIWWDWRDTEPDLPTARFLLRRRWQDVDTLLAMFPEHKELIEHVGNGRITFNRFDLTTESTAQALVDAHTRELRTTIDDLEWRDTERGMLCLGEFWYRTWHRGLVLKIGGKVIPVDTSNPNMAAAIAYGKLRPFPAVYPRIRLSWWIGPHRLADVATKKTRYPYVPFWGFREDRTGRPYGLIRPMLDPQDEYNARRAKLMWLLSAKRIFADSDALDTNYNDFRDLQREASRPDMMVVMNPERSARSTVRVDTDQGLASQQFEVMKDAQQLLQVTAGVYQAMMGQQSNASSGFAINSLVEQGSTTLAEINDNYRYARRLVGELLNDLIMEDIGGEERSISVGEGKRPKVIVLNQRQPDGTIANDTLRARTKVALDDVPSTPAYRAQQLQMLGELTKSLPPQVQGMIIDFVIEATDLSQRREIADRIRSAMGITDPDSMTPEEIADFEKKMGEQQEMAKTAAAIQARAAAADASEKEARAEKIRAESSKITQEVDKARADMVLAGQGQNTAELQAQLQQVLADAETARTAMESQLADARRQHQADVQSLNDALMETKAKADEQSRMVNTEIQRANIEAETRRYEAEQETQRVRIEAEAKQREEDIESKYGQQLQAMMKQIAEIRSDIMSKPEPAEGKEKESLPPAITIPVNITVEKGSGNKTATMKKQADGTYKMEVQEGGDKS